MYWSLLPQEKAMTAQLEAARIPLRKLTLNPKQQARSCTPKLQTLLAREVAVKEAAQKAIVSYMRSVFLQPNKVNVCFLCLTIHCLNLISNPWFIHYMAPVYQIHSSDIIQKVGLIKAPTNTFSQPLSSYMHMVQMFYPFLETHLL